MQTVSLIGAGVGGLATAIAGARRGLDVRLLEQASQLRSGGGALVIWSNAMAVLDQLGLAERVVAAGIRIRSATFQTTEAQLLQALPVRTLCDELGEPTVAIPRRSLMSILYSAVDRTCIRFGARLDRFEDLGDRVIAHFTDGTSAEGDVLIGSDGLHSVVRKQLHGDEQPRRAEQAAWVGIADCEHEMLPPGQMVGTLGKGQRFWATQVEPGHTYWYAIVREPDGHGQRRVNSKEELIQAYQGWHEPIQDLIRVTPREEILTTDICDRPPLRADWGRGRVTLLGDAAHPMTPDLGQGACQAVEGAAVLAACLVDEKDPVRALRLYEEKRRFRTSMLTQLCRLIATDSMSTKPLAAFRRDMLLRLTPIAVPVGILRSVIDHPPPA